MTATTPTYGWPYPQPADARGAGANAIRDLSLAQEATLSALVSASITPRWANGIHLASVALPNNVWSAIGYDSPAAESFTYDAATGTFTYTGPSGRWHLVSYGANVAVNGTQPNGWLRLVHNGVAQPELAHSDNYQHLGGAIPVRLDAGNTLQLQGKANDGTGAAGGAHDNAFLRIASL